MAKTLRLVEFDLIEVAEFNPVLEGARQTRQAIYSLFGIDYFNGNSLDQNVA